MKKMEKMKHKEEKIKDSNNNETNKYKSKSNETIFSHKDKSLQRSLMFYSEVDISNKSLSTRDEKIIQLMIKR